MYTVEQNREMQLKEKSQNYVYKITVLQIAPPVEENDSNDSDDHIIQPTRKRRNLINIPVEDVSSEEWEDVSESTDSPSIIEFDIHYQTAGPQTRSNIKEPVDYYTLNFTNELIDNIIKETNHYANEKIRSKQLSHKSTWHKWQDVTKQEFLSFILNMGLIHLSNLQEYWSTDSINKVPDAQGHHTDTDSTTNSTSTPLAEELLKMKCNLTGTVKIVHSRHDSNQEMGTKSIPIRQRRSENHVGVSTC
uniref:DDE_Tnp_1_7 domain-containing protein n=1 Tax=Glossina pallidipes TaxID=7398 RepID=A0A1B0ACH3_GLOPL